MARLQAFAKLARKRFGGARIESAIAIFESEVPGATDFRNILEHWDDDERYDRPRLSTRIRGGPRQRIAMQGDLFMPSAPADRRVASCCHRGQRTANGAEDRSASIPRMTPRTMRASR